MYYIQSRHLHTKVLILPAINYEVQTYTSNVLSDGRDSSVGIETRYGLDGPGIEFRWGLDFLHPSRPTLGAHPASCTMGTGCFPGGKAAGAWC